jgi:hypothetical protein
VYDLGLVRSPFTQYNRSVVVDKNLIGNSTWWQRLGLSAYCLSA